MALGLAFMSLNGQSAPRGHAWGHGLRQFPWSVACSSPVLSPSTLLSVPEYRVQPPHTHSVASRGRPSPPHGSALLFQARLSWSFNGLLAMAPSEV